MKSLVHNFVVFDGCNPTICLPYSEPCSKKEESWSHCHCFVWHCVCSLRCDASVPLTVGPSSRSTEWAMTSPGCQRSLVGRVERPHATLWNRRFSDLQPWCHILGCAIDPCRWLRLSGLNAADVQMVACITFESHRLREIVWPFDV